MIRSFHFVDMGVGFCPSVPSHKLRNKDDEGRKAGKVGNESDRDLGLKKATSVLAAASFTSFRNDGTFWRLTDGALSPAFSWQADCRVLGRCSFPVGYLVLSCLQSPSTRHFLGCVIPRPIWGRLHSTYSRKNLFEGLCILKFHCTCRKR